MPRRKKGPAHRLAPVSSAISGLALAGEPSLEAVASHLNTSRRSLQRRLQRRGTTFRALVQQCRFEIAGALLRETNLKVQEIATRLGYSTPGAFGRAFARSAGCSPTAFRNVAAPKTLDT